MLVPTFVGLLGRGDDRRVEDVAGGILSIALVGLLSNVIPYGLDQAVMRRLDPARFALLLALLPVTATVIGAIALSQTPTAIELVGIGLVVAGIAGRDRTGERPAPVELETYS